MNAIAPSEAKALINLQVEQALLGSLLAKPALIEHVPVSFHPDHFSDSFHQEIFKAVLDLGSGAQGGFAVVQAVALGDDSRGAYIAGLLSAFSGLTPGVIVAACAVTTDLWRRRALVEIAAKIHDDAHNPNGSLSADSVISEARSSLETMASSADTRSGLEVWDAGDDDFVIPPREWLLGNTFCRKFLSSILADGGVGKTALRVAQLVSLAIGGRLRGEHVFQRCRVLFVSLEDDRDELRRRINAVMRFYSIEACDLKGWLFLAAPKGLKLAEMREGSPQAGEFEHLLRAKIEKERIDIVSLDPFVKSHALSENDNNAIDFVCTILTKLAIDLNCAVDAPHHTKKGLNAAGDADNGRGASAMKNAGRLVYTLTAMSAEEAKTFGVPEGERRSLIRVDSGKVNITPSSRGASWYRLVGVPLLNATEMYPSGDEVQTVEPWHPPDTWEALDTVVLNAILDDIEAGLPNGSRYSAASRAGDRAAWLVVVRHAPDKTEQQAREVIKIWLKSGTLYEEDYEDPEQRKTRTGLRVNATKRPS